MWHACFEALKYEQAWAIDKWFQFILVCDVMFKSCTSKELKNNAILS